MFELNFTREKKHEIAEILFLQRFDLLLFASYLELFLTVLLLFFTFFDYILIIGKLFFFIS